jgi:hypothetical protein
LNIQAAAAQAIAKRTSIYRDGFPRDTFIQPSHMLDCLTVISRTGEVSARWQPTLDDLLAADWRVDEKTTPAKRTQNENLALILFGLLYVEAWLLLMLGVLAPV